MCLYTYVSRYNINSSMKYKYLSIKNTAICDQEK